MQNIIQNVNKQKTYLLTYVSKILSNLNWFFRQIIEIYKIGVIITFIFDL